MVADLAPSCKLELTSLLPSVGLPKAALKFPIGEVSFEENEDQEEEEEEEVDAAPKLAFSGILKAQVHKGILNAQYREDMLNLRYSFKVHTYVFLVLELITLSLWCSYVMSCFLLQDEQTTFIPSISLPSNAVSVSFKRRFSPSDKLSYLYNFDTNYWSAVYKHTVGKDYKVKAGYDSEIRLGWASIWVGDEDGKAKTAPMKTKVQLMLQVPKDDIQSSALMFRVKKRWDI
ncbi:putative outer envelope pore protein [Helianthus annuus]|nr:putative outer envelope pore protein [Helianthus annuus]KAJ0775872.1 putative outer envelope pore protein [Helianthus annuus]